MTDLKDDVLHVFQRRKDEPRVSAAWLATETMAYIEFPRSLHEKGYIAAHAHYCNLAGKVCRTEFTSENGAQHDLWPDLQTRYPISRLKAEEPEYVLLEHLTEDDGRFNVERLRAEANTKQKHADALEAFLDTKFGSQSLVS